jgi:hypothetical protein
MKQFIVPIIILIIVAGIFFFQDSKIKRLESIQEKNRMEAIKRQDSLHTAQQQLLINYAKSEEITYSKKDSIEKIKIQRHNETINNLHISYDSLPNF